MLKKRAIIKKKRQAIPEFFLQLLPIIGALRKKDLSGLPVVVTPFTDNIQKNDNVLGSHHPVRPQSVGKIQSNFLPLQKKISLQ